MFLSCETITAILKIGKDLFYFFFFTSVFKTDWKVVWMRQTACMELPSLNRWRNCMLRWVPGLAPTEVLACLAARAAAATLADAQHSYAPAAALCWCISAPSDAGDVSWHAAMCSAINTPGQVEGTRSGRLACIFAAPDQPIISMIWG